MRYAKVAATLGITCAVVVGLCLLFATDLVIANLSAVVGLLGVGLVAVLVGLLWVSKARQEE